jgi:hypothetical protein
MKREDIKIGQTVYVQEKWSGFILKGKVADIIDDVYAQIEDAYFVGIDANGKESAHDNYRAPSIGVRFKDIYATAKAAYDGIKEKEEALVKTYCDEIKDIQDLLQFPLKHPFGAEEYTDCEAIEAYKIMCKKITKLDIS